MVKLVRFITIVGVVLLLTACPETVNKRDLDISILNNSNEDIFWLMRSKENGEWYEIASIHSYMGDINKNKIISGDMYIEKRFDSDAINALFQKGWIKYYLFNYDSIKNIPWERICSERIILKEVTFNSWDDFERCNFEITYP